jgi:hypothetical protein
MVEFMGFVGSAKSRRTDGVGVGRWITRLIDVDARVNGRGGSAGVDALGVRLRLGVALRFPRSKTAAEPEDGFKVSALIFVPSAPPLLLRSIAAVCVGLSEEDS